LAKAEKRTRSEFFREAIRRYIEEKKWERIYRYGRMKAQEQGLGEADVERLVDEYRAEQVNVIAFAKSFFRSRNHPNPP